MINKTMHDLKFNSAFCQEFDVWNAHSFPADKEQVSLDITRLGKTGNISLKKKGVAESIFDGVSVAEYKERFFNKLKSFPLPFQEFINKQFHQGGELFSGIRYVNLLLLNSIGFESTGTTREFVFEQEGNHLLVEEIYRVKGLKFNPLPGSRFSFNPESKEEMFFDFSEDEKAKLEFLREQLKGVYSRGERVECSLIQENIDAMSINIADMRETLFAEKFADDEPVLMTFGVRHTVTLDKSATDGVSRHAFKEEDFSAKVHETLLPNNYTKNFEKIFSPKLPVSRWQPNHFKNVGLQEKYSNLIIKTYHNFIFLILTILLNYVNRPYVGLSAEQAKQFAEETAFQSSFSQRMRA